MHKETNNNLFSNLNLKSKKKSQTQIPKKDEVINPDQISFKSENNSDNNLLTERKTFFQPSTKRNVQVSTKFTQADYDLINWIAYEKRWKLIEVLENSIRLMVKKIKEEKSK